MEYPFPYIEKRTVYPRTFLKDVCVSLFFKSVISCEEAIRRFVDFRKRNFSISVEERADLKLRDEEGSAKIASSDNQVQFDFYRDSVSLKIKFPAYKQFDNLMSYLPTIIDYVKSQEVEVIDLMIITKFNEIKYGFQSATTPVELAMKGIFSEVMMNWENFKNPDFITMARWERRIDFSDDQSHTKAMAVYGFAKDDTDKKKGSLTLKTSAETIDPVELDNIEKELILCNDIVDRAFHWCASDNILKEMRKK